MGLPGDNEKRKSPFLPLGKTPGPAGLQDSKEEEEKERELRRMGELGMEEAEDSVWES